MNEDTKIGLALIVPLIALQFLVSLYPMGYSLYLAFHNASFEQGIGTFVGVNVYLVPAAMVVTCESFAVM